jgi:hypothetical protein
VFRFLSFSKGHGWESLLEHVAGCAQSLLNVHVSCSCHVPGGTITKKKKNSSEGNMH